MQHTKFDRWLWRKYVHINQIYFNTMPGSFPRGMELMESDPESGARYRYRATTRSEVDAQELCDIFLAENITYAARVQERDTPFARFVGNQNRSVTLMTVWIFLFFMGIIFLLSGVTQMAITSMMEDRNEVRAADKIKSDEIANRMSR